MKIKLFSLAPLLFLFVSAFAFGQNDGKLAGKLVDENNEPVAFATVLVLEGDRAIGGAFTDENGDFSIKPIPAGTYDIRFSFLGYEEIYPGIIINQTKTTRLNASLIVDYGPAPFYRYERPHYLDGPNTFIFGRRHIGQIQR